MLLLALSAATTTVFDTSAEDVDSKEITCILERHLKKYLKDDNVERHDGQKSVRGCPMMQQAEAITDHDADAHPSHAREDASKSGVQHKDASITTQLYKRRWGG